MLKKILMTLLLISVQAQAHDYTGKFGLGLGAGFPIPSFGNAFNDAADAKWALGVHGRYHFSEKLGVELGYTHDKFDDVRNKFHNYDALAFWRLNGASNFTPIFGLGAGLVKISKYSSSSLKLALLAKAGVAYDINSSWSLDATVDYRYVSKILGDMPDSRAHVISPTVSLTWYFGGERATPVATPAPAVKEEVKKTKDIPKQVVVDEKGEITIDVGFSSGDAVIDQKYHSHLKEVAEFFKRHPKATAEISGHTDSSGSRDLNVRLSQRRALAVVNYLVDNFGIDRIRLDSRGYGPDRPIASNDTEEGKRKNRRVVAVVKDHQ